jgi:hypothetical protein
MAEAGSWPNPSAIRFHVLRDTRDIDTSELPAAVTYIHNVNDLIPVFDRDEFVLHGYLPENNSQFSDADVRRFVAHMRLLQAIKNTADPDESLHHVIFEDQVNILPEFMTKHVPLLVNLPEYYDTAHIYVFPQQRWIFDDFSVYETLPRLKGVCAYAISPKGRKKVLNNMGPMTAPIDVMIRKMGLVSYTVVNDFVEHIDPVNGIGPYTEF